MLRMTPLASAIVALLLGIEAYAAEETFDTHFMIGGMKDQQVANIRLDDNQPLPGQYDIDIYVNKQWRGKYEIIVKDNPQETCLSREMIKRLGINTPLPVFRWYIATFQFFHPGLRDTEIETKNPDIPGIAPTLNKLLKC